MRDTAGVNQSLSSAYVWPDGFGNRKKLETILDKLPEKNHKTVESTSSIHDVLSICGGSMVGKWSKWGISFI